VILIVLEIDSGLGNQMFKYAAAMALAHKHNTDLYLNVDIACIEGYGIGQTFQLDKFDITAGYANRSIMRQFDTIKSSSAYYAVVRASLRSLKLVRFVAKTLRKSGLNVSKIVPIGVKNPEKIFREIDEDWRYKPQFLELPDNILLSGYYPSYKYFDHIREIIIQEFSLKVNLSINSKAIETEIVNSNSISIHFRRGDVIINPHYKSWYEGVITDNYYNNAIKYFCENVENPHFFIFSNEIEWVKQNFQIPGIVTYVDHNTPETGYEDMYLMSRCKHNVTTGSSSFSWWAAYLNANPNKIVLRARRMNCHDHLNNPEDFYLPDWIIIES
jgi:hypothetical protein